jgi:hypothetical protein
MAVEIPETDWLTDPMGVFVVCPECRTTLRLDHDVDADGNVTPSLDCPLCTFHDTARLVAWKLEDP